jgi:cytidyltransferase-like protein
MEQPVGRVAVIGRFQPFHWGHFEYLIEASRLGRQLLVAITNPTPAQTRISDQDPARATEEANPFSYEERCSMVGLSLDRIAPHLNAQCVPCDLRSASLLRTTLGSADLVAVTIYDAWGEEKAGLLRDAGYEVTILWRRAEKIISASEIRSRIRSGLPWEHLVPYGTRTVIEGSLGWPE